MDLKHELSIVYDTLSKITLSQDNVDLMAFAKAKLREIYQQLDKNDQKE